MRYAHVKLIVAMGNFGQIGNKGGLPWHAPADLKQFRRLTMGGICIVGKGTAATLPELPGRDVVIWNRENSIPDYCEANAHRMIWVCGGAQIYKLWLPFVGTSVISHIDFNDKCDTYMPWLWRYPMFNRKQTT